MTGEAYRRGTVVLVPFPFTDLSGRKRRPALVVSPEGFGRGDLILCAITSQLPQTPYVWEVPLGASDMAEGDLPKKSIIKTGKLFTMHERLVATRFGAVKNQKLQEVLLVLRGLFTLDQATDGVPNDTQKAKSEPDE